MHFQASWSCFPCAELAGLCYQVCLMRRCQLSPRLHRRETNTPLAKPYLSPPRSFLTSEFICSNRSFTHIISFNLHKSMKVNINISVQLIEENWLSEVIDSVSFTWLEGVELGFVFRAVQVQRLPKAWVRGSDVCGTLL